MRYVMILIPLLVLAAACDTSTDKVRGADATSIGGVLYERVLEGNAAGVAVQCGKLASISDDFDHDLLVDPCNDANVRHDYTKARTGLEKVLPPETVSAAQSKIGIRAVASKTNAARLATVDTMIASHTPTP